VNKTLIFTLNELKALVSEYKQLVEEVKDEIEEEFSDDNDYEFGQRDTYNLVIQDLQVVIRDIKSEDRTTQIELATESMKRARKRISKRNSERRSKK
jgi:hypothetical protein